MMYDRGDWLFCVVKQIVHLVDAFSDLSPIILASGNAKGFSVLVVTPNSLAGLEYGYA